MKQVAEIFVEAGHCKTIKEARSAIQNGEVKFNEHQVKDPMAKVINCEGKLYLWEPNI